MRKIVLIGLAAFALAPSSALARRERPVVGAAGPCAGVKGVGHEGGFGPGTHHFNIRMDLTAGVTGPQTLTWHESLPQGGLRVAGFHFEAQSVSCETTAEGFVLQAVGTSSFRLSRTDVRQASEVVLVEERNGVTTVKIGTGPPGEGAPVLQLPVGRAGAPALGTAGVQAHLRSNSLHVL